MPTTPSSRSARRRIAAGTGGAHEHATPELLRPEVRPLPTWLSAPQCPIVRFRAATRSRSAPRCSLPHNGSDKTVVEQPGSFRFGYDGGAVLFESKNLGRHRSDPAGLHLLENEWNRIDAVYDGEVLRLYVQGIPVYEAIATGERFVDGETRWQMGDLDGLRAGSHAGGARLHRRRGAFNQIEHVVPDGELELCADFDAFDPRDAGRHALPLQLVGHCDVVNLVPALRTGTAARCWRRARRRIRARFQRTLSRFWRRCFHRLARDGRRLRVRERRAWRCAGGSHWA